MPQSIAKDLIDGKNVEVNDVKFLLWVTLCKLQEFTNTVDLDGHRVFDCDAMLDSLDERQTDSTIWA
jgi:hypothetical protein